MESSIHRNLVRKLTSLKINESFRKENVSVSFEVQTLEILGACAIHHLYEKFKNVKKKSLQSCQPMHILFLIRVYLPYDYFTYLVISVSIWWMNRLFIILRSQWSQVITYYISITRWQMWSLCLIRIYWYRLEKTRKSGIIYLSNKSDEYAWYLNFIVTHTKDDWFQ